MTYILALLTSFLMTSFVEYALHRAYLHSAKGHMHVTIHHKQYNSREHFAIEGTRYKDVASGFWYIALTVLLSFPLGIVLWVSGYVDGILYVLTAIAYAYGLEIFHVLIHRGYNGLWRRFIIYKKLEAHHFTHHRVYTSNFGIGSTLWDYILGTKKRTQRML